MLNLFYKIAIFAILSLFISGCQEPQKTHTNSKLVFINISKINFKYYDVAFIKYHDESENLDIKFMEAGTSYMLFELGKYSVCIKNRCYPKTTFIKKVFGKGYEKNILNNIFRGKSILSGRDKVSKTIGFTQKIDDDKYHLDYIVAQDKITFTDYNKDIKIIIKTLKD